MSYDAWIGREQRATDHLGEALAQRWLATFDLPAQDSATLPAMPQGIHFTLCTPTVPTAALGEDGHPARDDGPDSFLPPFPMPRRMWASSRIEFRAAIVIGAEIERVSRIASITEKDGSTGKLAFVEVAHETSADGILSVLEMQTLVYRDAAAPDAPLSPSNLSDGQFETGEWDAHHALTPDPRLLLRYSALTFNTHRIHYDAPYASDVERYRGLVVHGPLTASLLLQLAARELGENALRRFEFRGVSPAIAGEPMHMAMRGSENGFEFGAFAQDGRALMTARASA